MDFVKQHTTAGRSVGWVNRKWAPFGGLLSCNQINVHLICISESQFFYDLYRSMCRDEEILVLLVEIPQIIFNLAYNLLV